MRDVFVPAADFQLLTPRLRLRRFTRDDAPFVFRLLNSPGWLRFIGDRGVRTIADAEAYLTNGPLAHYPRHGFGLYHVARRADHCAVGMCGLLQRDYLDTVDLGFAVLPEFGGQGYATEAAQAVLAHARDDHRCPRLAAIVRADNAASTRVLEKLGLHLIGPLRTPQGDDVQLYRRDLAP